MRTDPERDLPEEYPSPKLQRYADRGDHRRRIYIMNKRVRKYETPGNDTNTRSADL